MPATVTTNFLGISSDDEQRLRARVEHFFDQYPENWTLSILGAQNNTIWKLRVTASDGHTTWEHNLHGEDGGHDIDKILTVLDKITLQIPPIASSASSAS
jgi:hypothetical protein